MLVAMQLTLAGLVAEPGSGSAVQHAADPVQRRGLLGSLALRRREANA
jgi:hypothetical protein